ncbi:hypothetical protein Tco_1478160 [Tanacetum coccineum]
MIRLRAEAPSTSHPLPSSTPPSGTPPLLPIPLPTSSPPLLLPSTVCRADVFEVTLPPWKWLCIALSRRRDPERYVGYRIMDTWDEMVEDMLGTPRVTDVADLSQRMIDFFTIVKQDIDEIYGRLDDAHDDRTLMSGQLNMLYRDRRAHAHTTLLMEREARLSRGSIAVRDCRVAGSRPHPIGTTYGDIDTDEDTTDIGDSSLESVGTR